jgi:hypothetical protein
MKQIIDESLKADTDVYQSISHAADVLLEVAGETIFSPTIRWESAIHPTPHLEVMFDDEYGTFRRTIPVSTVKPDRELRYRMIRLWGDFLQKRSKIIMDQIMNEPVTVAP